MTVPDLTGWLPIRVAYDGRAPVLDWCWFGQRRLSEPFFDHSVEACLERPFNLLFRPQLSIDAVAESAPRFASAEPSGFVFHLSRCGSTLVSQMFAALPFTVVVSEASVVDGLLRLCRQLPELREQRVTTWLRTLIGALIRPREGGETASIVKLDAWHAVHLELLRRAYPDTPWLFLYRDPLEVLVSLARQGGGRVVPGVVDPRLLNLDGEDVYELEAEDYQARILAAICGAALDAGESGGGLLVNYSQLPEVAWTTIAGHFGIPLSDDDSRRMGQRAGFAAKVPAAAHRDDRGAKRAAATPAMRRAVERWLIDPYRRLEALRGVTGGASSTAAGPESTSSVE